MMKSICYAAVLLALLTGLFAAKAVAQGQIENLGPNVNSEYNEALPIISADGKTLYFVRENSPENAGGIPSSGKNQDIWFSTMNDDGSWSPAQNFDKLNTSGSEFVSSVTPDGNILLLGRNYVYRTREGWSSPQDLDIRNFRNLDSKNRANFFLANDGQVLIMSFKGANTKGFLDLYVSFRQEDESWSTPQSLGNTINSYGDDFAPFLAADGKTLYFASNGHKETAGSEGKFDIYVSHRQGGSWTNWSKPENLGPTVNTPGVDLYFVIPACGDFAYMVSQHESMGGNDIYRLPIPEGMKPNPVMLLTGKTVDKVSGDYLTAQIKYYTANDNKLAGRASTNPNTGDYTVVLPVGEKYNVVCMVDNYVNDTFTVDLAGKTECVVENHKHHMVPTPTIVSGKVINKATNKPLPGKITFSPDMAGQEQTVQLTESGEYRVKVNGASDKVSFKVTAQGFDTMEENVAFTASQKHNEVKKDFFLSASNIPLTGAILSEETGQPVAKPTLKYQPASGGTEVEVNVGDGAAFNVSMPAEDAQYKFTADGYGFYPKTVTVSISASQMEAKQDIKLETQPPLLLKGTVYNEKTKDPLPGAKIFVQYTEDNATVTTEKSGQDGKYRIGLQEVINYNLVCKKDGYISVYEKVELESDEMYQEYEKDMELLPIEIGTTVRLNNILFETAKAKLRPESFEELDRLVSLMEDASKLVIEIEGHTDDVGSDSYNMTLSDKRANAVRDYLLEKGISPDRIQAKGYGETKPEVPNDSDENRALNRRVQFRVVSID